MLTALSIGLLSVMVNCETGSGKARMIFLAKYVAQIILLTALSQSLADCNALGYKAAQKGDLSNGV